MPLQVLTRPSLLLYNYLLGGAFHGSYKLKEINIGANVSNIASLFEHSSNYAFTLNIDKSNSYYIVENNVLYTKNKDTLVSVLYKILWFIILNFSLKFFFFYDNL